MAAGTFRSVSGSLDAVVTARLPSCSKLNCLRRLGLSLPCGETSARFCSALANKSREPTMIEAALRQVDFLGDADIAPGGHLFMGGFLGFHEKSFPGFARMEPSWRAHAERN